MATEKPKPLRKEKVAGCHAPVHLPHPDHSEYLPRLNRIEGQLGGIQKMIQDGRYCVDILVQFRAVMAALRSVEVGIFEKHVEHCLSSALHSKDKKQIDQKLKELMNLLLRRTSI